MESAIFLSSLGPFSWGILETWFGHPVCHCCCCRGIFASCCFQQTEPGNRSRYMHVNTHTHTDIPRHMNIYMHAHMYFRNPEFAQYLQFPYISTEFFLAWPCSIFVWPSVIVRTQQDQCIYSLLTSELHQEYFPNCCIHITTCNKPIVLVQRIG